MQCPETSSLVPVDSGSQLLMRTKAAAQDQLDVPAVCYLLTLETSHETFFNGIAVARVQRLHHVVLHAFQQQTANSTSMYR